jgi:hypothetical protein
VVAAVVDGVAAVADGGITDAAAVTAAMVVMEAVAKQRGRTNSEIKFARDGKARVRRPRRMPRSFFWCAEHVRQLGGGSPLLKRVEVKS